MPLSEKLKLHPGLTDPSKLEKKPIRDGYGLGVVAVGEKNQNIIVLCADLAESTRSAWFQEKFPERFIELGVAEQNMASVASGLAAVGKIPFITSYATFSPGRNWEQIRTTICYNAVNVKVVGSHAGVSVGPDGATHQAIEDIAITRVIPNLKVFAPCDVWEAKRVTEAIAEFDGPAYERLAREKTPLLTTEETPFEVGRAQLFWEPIKEDIDIVIITCGSLVFNAIRAASELEKEGLSVAVLNNASIKPMDEKTIIDLAKKAGCVVTVEEHQISGGMGSAVAEILAQNWPVPIEFIGVGDRFGESGPPDTLIEKLGMGVDSIKEAVRRVIKRK
jgi:transketolase